MADSAILYGDNDYPVVINNREDILDSLEFYIICALIFYICFLHCYSMCIFLSD